MSRAQRREQLIDVARDLFAAHGFDAVTIEHIATAAGVTKPVVYDHFGSKDGLYEVIVDREFSALTKLLNAQLKTNEHPLTTLQNVVSAMLTYIEDRPSGFALISHQSPNSSSDTRFVSVLDDVADEVTPLLAPILAAHNLDVDAAPIYSQLLAGALARLGTWWSVQRHPSREVVAAHATNLLWNGLRNMSPDPPLPTDHAERREPEQDTTHSH